MRKEGGAPKIPLFSFDLMVVDADSCEVVDDEAAKLLWEVIIAEAPRGTLEEAGGELEREGEVCAELCRMTNASGVGAGKVSLLA